MVEEPQVGVHQSDALLVTGINDNGVSGRARWSCDVLDTTLDRHTEEGVINKDAVKPHLDQQSSQY